jgi:hypothetical protein
MPSEIQEIAPILEDWNRFYAEAKDEPSSEQQTLLGPLLGVTVMVAVSAGGWAAIIFVVRRFW